MGVEKFLSEYKKICLDTNIFIYAIEQHPKYWGLAKSVLD